MILTIIVWFGIFLFLYSSVGVFQALTKDDRIEFIKLASYCIGIAIIASIVTMAITVLIN